MSVENAGVNHANQQRLNRALAEPVHNALHGAAGNLVARLGRAVNEGAAFNGVGEISLLFKATQHRANGGILERTVKCLSHLLGPCLTQLPNQSEDGPFEFSQFRWVVIDGSVTVHSVTDGST